MRSERRWGLGGKDTGCHGEQTGRSQGTGSELWQASGPSMEQLGRGGPILGAS